MWFRKPDNGSRQAPFAGKPGAMDGRSAVFDASRAAGDVIVAVENDDSPAAARARDVRTAPADDIPAVLTGLALEGVRASAVVENLGDAAGLSAAAGKRLAFVMHLLCRSRTRQAASSQGAHDDYHGAADTGAFLMFARNVQEVADFSFIARRVAELSLTPGVCAQDLYQTACSVQSLQRPGADLAGDYLGQADDMIPCPNDAQSIVFGPARRRVPVLLDIDRPAGIGGVQDRDSYFRALVSQHPFFFSHIAEMIDRAMRDFGERTGRFYERVSGYRADDADVIVVGQGAVMESLVPVVDALRREKKIRAGLVNISVLRPFAGAALSHMLSGKRTVVVLERTDSPLGDSPLSQDVRAAIDRAVENGQSPDVPPYPDHAVIRRLDERPRLFSAVYGIGGDLPSFEELAAVFEHASTKDGARRFFVGARFDTETRRFPHLETLQQRLSREYPGLNRLTIKDSALRPVPTPGGAAFDLRSLSVQGGVFAANLLARALCDAMNWDVRTFPDGGLEKNLQPVSVTTVYGKGADAPHTRPAEVAVVLVSGEHLMETLPVECALSYRGVLIVGSVQEPQAWWKNLSQRTANWIRGGEFRVCVVDARKIAAEIAAHASFIDQLAIWSLIGAFVQRSLGLDTEANDRLIASLRSELAADGVDASTVETVVKALHRGGEEVRDVSWEKWSDVTHPVGEPDAPWTLRDAAHSDGTVFDPVRFWNSVGYLYDRGQSTLTLADPHLATAVLPARSSAFRDLSRYRLRLPEWIPSTCTGCADCWTQCPESALPPTIRSASELLDAAMRESERTGGALVQFKRIGDALAKQAYQLARQQAPQPYETLGALLDDAFVRVCEKAGLTGEKLDAVKAEYDRVRAVVAGYPVAVTDRFFTAAHTAAAGTGRLLSITVNPLSCTACGVCVTACPEGAFAWTEQTPARLESARQDWNFLMGLPPLAETVLADLVHENDLSSQPLRLLDTAVYHSLVGGDGSFSGNGAKTAVHLVTAAIESQMRPRHAAHVQRLSRLIERIEQRIQGTVDETAKINDFEDFGRRLSRIAPGEMTPDVLRGLAGDSDPAHTVDAPRLARLTALLHALKEQRHSYDEGDGRARLLLVIDPVTGNFWNGTYPYNPHPHPWVSHLSRDAVALARGVCEGVVRRLGTEFALFRRAERELEDHPDGDDAGSTLMWEQFTADERALVPAVVVLADAERPDTNAIMSVLESAMPVHVMLVDRDAIGADGAKPVQSVFFGPRMPSAFMLQSSIGYPGHLIQGVVESVERGGPALLRVYAPDAVGDGLPADGIVELARLAVDSRAVPLLTVRPDGDAAGVALDDNPDPVCDWTMHELTVKEASGADGKITVAVTAADWASRQARYRAHFKVVSAGNRSDRMKPIADYLALAPDAREAFEPFIHVRDRSGRHAIATVSAEMVRAADRVARTWREIRDANRATPAPAMPQPASPVATAAPAPGVDAGAVQALAENLLRLSGYGTDDAFFKRRLRDFVSQPGNADGDAG